MSFAIQLAERGFLSDNLIRKGIRKLLAERLRSVEASKKTDLDWIEELSAKTLAEQTEAANEQHYEIPAAYFLTALGKHLKYSCGYWP